MTTTSQRHAQPKLVEHTIYSALIYHIKVVQRLAGKYIILSNFRLTKLPLIPKLISLSEMSEMEAVIFRISSG